MVQTDVTFYKNALIRMLDDLPAEQVSEIFTFALFIRNRSQVRTDKPHGITVKAIPAAQLEPLVGIVAWGGDAVEDAERLYDEC